MADNAHELQAQRTLAYALARPLIGDYTKASYHDRVFSLPVLLPPQPNPLQPGYLSYSNSKTELERTQQLYRRPILNSPNDYLLNDYLHHDCSRLPVTSHQSPPLNYAFP